MLLSCIMGNVGHSFLGALPVIKTGCQDILAFVASIFTIFFKSVFCEPRKLIEVQN